MPIINLQRRQTEVGRIRIGETKDTGRKNKHGQPIMRPVKLEKFRITSPSQALIAQVAALYGGDPAEWRPQGGGAPQWEVYTEARSLPVVVPPNSVSQWYESWAGGACVRRCDGERELLKDRPCMCSPEPTERECKPTTRISLMLAEVPGIGVWRLETHGFYAATELPAVAQLLAAAGGYVAARLELEERTARREKADGSGMETRRWMVPVLHVDAAPHDLLALGAGGRIAVEGAPQRQAIESGPAQPNGNGAAQPVLTAEVALQSIAACRNQQQLDMVKEDCRQARLTDKQVLDAWMARSRELAASPPRQSPAASEPEVVEGEPEPDGELMWTMVLAAAGERGWSGPELERRFQEHQGVPVDEADGFQLQRFLDAMKSGEVA